MQILRLTKILLIAVAVSFPLFAEEEETAAIEESVSDSSPFTLGVTSHLLGTQSTPANDTTGKQFKHFTHETGLNAEYGSVSGQMSFSSRFTPDGQQSRNSGFLMEKKSVTYQDDVWNIKAGDAHVELGRGLILSLYREPVFGIDNTLEGAHVTAKPGGADVSIFGGRVNAWKAPLSTNPVDQGLSDREVYIAGASLGLEIADGTKLGPQYAAISRQNIVDKSFTDESHLGGMFLSSDLSDEVQFYGESSMGFHRDQIERSANAHLSYASLTWSPESWKVRLEGKDYRNVGRELSPFRRPPMLDEDIVTTINNSNITAGKVYTERKLGDATVYSSFLYGYEREDFNTQMYHPVIGTKYALATGIDTELKAGYRLLPHHNTIKHGSAKAKIKTGKGQYLELEYRKQIYENGLETAGREVNDRNMGILGYTFSERWNATLGYEYLPNNTAANGNHFANAGVGYKDGALQAKTFVGKTSGGSLCSGGVCLPVPAYTGAYLETIYTF